MTESTVKLKKSVKASTEKGKTGSGSVKRRTKGKAAGQRSRAASNGVKTEQSTENNIAKPKPKAGARSVKQAPVGEAEMLRTRGKSGDTALNSKASAASGAQKKKTAKDPGAPRSKSGASRKDRASKAKTASSGKRNASKGTTRASKPQTKKSSGRVRSNTAATAADRKRGTRNRRGSSDDLFLEKKSAAKKKTASTGGKPPARGRTLFGVLNACLLIAIGILVALGVRQRSAYADFLQMRSVVDQQTFYDGTTVEGVDVSKMTLSNALDYWRDRVEPRYAERTAVLDNGTTITAQELGYCSDYESVLSAAWSAGRNGSLEERYRMAAHRQANPVAYDITRVDYSEDQVDQFAQLVAVQVDQPAVDAEVSEFNAETYEFTFTESRVGQKLDTDALKRDVKAAIENGGGNVALSMEELQPAVTTDEVSQRYGLIDYAITNANSSSKARLNNIKLAMSFINGTRLAPGETFSFNEVVGQRTASRGFRKATAYSGGEVTEEIGGGICQVSTTLFNAAVKADMKIEERHNHSLTVGYVDKGKDATVDWGHQDLRFTNTSTDDVFICCYLTEDKRVRFGIFGRMLPDGEKITLEAKTTEVIKYDTEYQPTAQLAAGATQVVQPGRNGYKAEAYKVRWDAQGNQLSRELLCSSFYKKKNEIVAYGA